MMVGEVEGSKAFQWHWREGRRLLRFAGAVCFIFSLSESCWTSGVRRQATSGSSTFLKRPVPRLKIVTTTSKEATNAAWSIARLSELCQKDGALQVLQSKGVTLIPGAFQAEVLEALLTRFLGLEEREQLDVMRFGNLRAARTPVHLPFQEPFTNLPLLGQQESLRDVLTGYLGENFELESAMVIKVGSGASAQSAHMDTEDKGSLSVHVPLQPLHKDFAPLSFLLSTHEDPSILTKAAPKMKRLIRDDHRLARERQRAASAKEEYFLQWGAKEVALLADVDFRRGANRGLIRGSSAIGLEPGDEVTHVNELDFISWLQVKDFVPEFQDNLSVRVLRPVAVQEPKAEAASPGRPATPRNQLRVWMNGRQHQDKLMVGAPLQVGDALIYDSRTVHWGMANRDWQNRYVLYLNFKRGDFRGTSPDALAIATAQRRCRIARERFRDKLTRELHYMA